MEYYRLTQSENINNTLLPLFPTASEIWSETVPVFVPGKADNPKGELVFLPFYEGHAFMVASAVKGIWDNWQKGGRYRACALGSIEQRRVYPYYFSMPRVLECVHPNTLYHKTGETKALCINLDIVGANRVFCVRTLRRMMLIVAEDVLEEMLRENVNGFNWVRIETGRSL